MTQLKKSNGKPAIIVAEPDHLRLTDLAAAAESRFPAVAEELQSEMSRAQVLAPGAVPAGVVQMGSTVEFRSDTAPQRRVTLVYPGQADIGAGRISILTPIGTALIGLSVGQTIAWTAPGGRRHELTVIGVEPPPAG